MQEDNGGIMNSNNETNPFISKPGQRPKPAPKKVAKKPAPVISTVPTTQAKPTAPKSPASSVPQSDVSKEIIAQPASDRLQWSIRDDNNQQRGNLWYLIWVVCITLLAAVAFLVQYFIGGWQFWTTVGLAIIIFITLIFTNKRSDNIINYSLDNDGVSIDGKFHPYNEFRAFGLSNEDNSWVITLIPIKRLAVATTIAIPSDLGEIIVDTLGVRLPMEDISTSLFSQLSNRLKF